MFESFFTSIIIWKSLFLKFWHGIKKISNHGLFFCKNHNPSFSCLRVKKNCSSSWTISWTVRCTIHLKNFKLKSLSIINLLTNLQLIWSSQTLSHINFYTIQRPMLLALDDWVFSSRSSLQHVGTPCCFLPPQYHL